MEIKRWKLANVSLLLWSVVERCVGLSFFSRILPATLLSSSSLSLARRASVKEDAGDGPGGVGRQVGGLRGGPLVPLCAQPEPVDLGREEVVEDEHDRFGTALEVQLLEFWSGRKMVR